MRMKKQLSVVFVLLVGFGLQPLVSLAQSVPFEMIKADSSYIWGESVNENREEARRQAEVNLVSKVQVSMNIHFSDVMRETKTEDGIQSFEDTHANVQSYTGLLLKGLQRAYRQEGESWFVLAYLHRDSLRAAMQLRKKKIQEYVQQGVSAAKQMKIGEGLRNFYWGYLLARTYPNRIKFPSLDHTTPKTPQIAIQEKINKIFDNIEVTAESCYKEGRTIIVPLRFQYLGEKVADLYFSYYGGIGTEYAIVEEGAIDIPIYDEPTSRSRKLTLNIEYVYANEMGIDPEIESLHGIFNEAQFDNLKSVELTFPWIKAQHKRTQFPEPRSEAVEVLYDNKDNLQRFFEILGQYQKLGIIQYGKKESLGKRKDLFVAIADKKGVETILYFDGEKYIEYQSNTTLSELNKYKNKRAIWFSELN